VATRHVVVHMIGKPGTCQLPRIGHYGNSLSPFNPPPIVGFTRSSPVLQERKHKMLCVCFKPVLTHKSLTPPREFPLGWPVAKMLRPW
jgi:hypothetical protein